MKFQLVNSFAIITIMLCEKDLAKGNTLNLAIEKFIHQWNNSKLSEINFIVDQKKFHGDSLQEVLLNLRGEFSIEIRSLRQYYKPRELRQSLNIIFGADHKSLENFCISLSTDHFQFSGYFLLTLHNFSFPEMRNIFDILWKKSIYNVNVLTINEKSSNVPIFTFIPFKRKICNDVSPEKINEFNSESMKWTTNNFFPDKLNNLHNCSIRIGTYRNLVGTMVDVFDNGTKIYHGIEDDLLNEFVQSLKFSVDIKVYPVDSGVFFKNKTATGLMKRVFEGTVDMIYGYLSLQSSRTEFLSATNPIFNDKIILVIPPALLIGSIRKLLLPFHVFTWTGLLAMIIAACLIATIIKCLPQSVHDFVIGKNVRNEYLGIFYVLTGGSQKKLPFRNFARFMLMLFVIFCLVMRVAYTGSLYHQMKSDVTTKEVSSIDDLDEMDFTFYMYESLAVRLKDVSSMRK